MIEKYIMRACDKLDKQSISQIEKYIKDTVPESDQKEVLQGFYKIINMSIIEKYNRL